jgi:cell division transport system permease protein
MGNTNLGYHLKEGFRSIFTHGLMSFAAVSMIVACLLIMGSFSLVAVNLNHMLGDLEQQNEFLAYIDESLPRTSPERSSRRSRASPTWRRSPSSPVSRPWKNS